MSLGRFRKAVRDLRKRIARHTDLYSHHEAAVRDSLVYPVLEALGWDLYDPTRVIPESSTEDGRPDVELRQGKHRLFVEIKNLSKDLHDSIAQMARYAIGEGVEYGAITNGGRWMLFRTFEKGKTTEERVVWEVDLEGCEPSAAYERLSMLGYGGLSSIRPYLKKLAKVEKAVKRVFSPHCEAFIEAMARLVSKDNRSLARVDGDEIRRMVRMRVGELLTGPSDARPEGPQVLPSKPRGPGGSRGIRIAGRLLPANTAREVLVGAAEFLVQKGRLTGHVPFGPKRSIVNSEPRHHGGRPFKAHKRLSNGLYVDVWLSAKWCMRRARRLLERSGYQRDQVEIVGFPS